ncbi:Dbl homology domain-containing protein [Auriscalpium vulgare]|uniref:Dbl homology domain-containing protein n=1 Tax=Auriscalpium vulgare TaxID=40419 RepID=A0ACB8S4F9_9AGAM|nr:Dbl homology domain-containing protein [Auriscalpium vulgare]
MKALFSRLNRGLKDKTAKDPKDSDQSAAYRQEKIPQLPPLRDWPPGSQQTAPQQPQRNSEALSIASSFKPLPELSDRPLPPIEEPASAISEYPSLSSIPLRGPLSDVAEEESIDTAIVTRTPRLEQESAGRSSRKTANGSISTANGSTDAPKRVAFLSPPPTPVGINATLPEEPPAKTSVSRFQAAQGKDTRGSTSTAASGSRTDVGSSKGSTHTVKATSTRTATSPYPGKSFGEAASIHQSLRSGTPFSQKSAGGSSVVPPASWSEGAEEDLVSNLGPRERTRQEVLWEIVASEERYVAELVKMKDTFLVPLLHPYATSPVLVASPTLDYDDYHRIDSPSESIEHLPIASRFLSPTLFRSDTPTAIDTASRREDKDTPNMDSESMNSDDEDNDQMGKGYQDSRRNGMGKHNHPRSPYGVRTNGKGTSLPFPTRSHHSLPPPPRMNPSASTHSLGRQSYVGPSTTTERNPERERKTMSTQSARGLLRKSKKSLTKGDYIPNGGVSPAQLPDDLRQCLDTIEKSILEGHLKLSDGLRKRYDDQYPLVRSLADVFVANSHILRGYADYVLHLERALEQVEDALSQSSATKRPKKQDADEWLKICTFLHRLEQDASEKGETGLAISLSKPFQRLLKYPLLFQNLLFHTDPSTFEYESTLQMVAEVENIVRSIEDEKIQKEERDKTRDVLARIEGLDKQRQLAAPKPSRVLVEEKVLPDPNDSSKPSTPPITGAPSKAVKGKSSFKRFSDALQSSNGVGGKKDLWLVVFNDVTLRCQRTGTTSLPLGSSHASRANSLPELQGKSKYATTGRRNTHLKPRNLYKFLKIESWNTTQPREGVVSMEEVVRSRAQIHSPSQPRIIPMPDDDDDDGGDSDDLDRKSKMSFSYWGADKVTLQKPLVKAGRLTAGPNGTRRPGPVMPTGYSRESSANAKFGTRMMSGENPAPRPASRRTQATPTSRRPQQSDDNTSVKVTVTPRPAWDGSTRSQIPQAPVVALKRSRNTSQNSAATTRATTTPTNKLLASPAPSEDSGVGLYRQMMAQDPSLNRSQS